jgi:hypothetical protein
MAHRFEQVGMAGGHATEGIAGTDPGDGAFVAIKAAVVPHLEEERTIAKAIAAFDAFGTANTQALINRVLVIGVFDKSALDGRGWTKAVFGAGVEVVGFRLEVTGAELAIAANRIGVHTFDCRLLQHAVGGAVAATHAFLRVDLPHSCLGGTAASHYPQQPSQPGYCCDSRSVAQKLSASYRP